MKKVKAKFKWIRISPTKLRRIANAVRGRECNHSLNILKTIPNKGARIVEKIILSVIANAKNNNKLDSNNLKVNEIVVDSAGMLRRFRAKSRGRVGPVKKRMAHLSVTVSPIEGEE